MNTMSRKVEEQPQSIVGTSRPADRWLSCFRVKVNREFPPIENVDAGVNVDMGSHPVGPTTPQNSEVQISK